MNYTQNYHLPQWALNDRIMMDDFNAAMAKLEDGLTGNRMAAQQDDAALSARIAVVEALPYVMGSYTASEKAQDIHLGFRPSFVLIFQTASCNTYDQMLQSICPAGWSRCPTEKMRLTSTGFHLEAEDWKYKYPMVNYASTYEYIAFR